ncbi:MAG: NAD(P)(+) transhydrogenase (Re/Si-specific) subunit beta [Deltaproteobacteria bacterium]|nr:NAD(P)(+) transhydrogenase (Re/Si-specific) subunit beta [Deltaproteobacteria bacterium]MBW2384433.1 NAD(P)(+) transhydrogenase (Re/Si-specific) subunit beta [Deltaproteobacteria bacterium]MBW2695249.1 NAD(P)(+) transhydrogenase (Re/Si-specific) subunit beta [Deltaproteobacteria bacterium]
MSTTLIQFSYLVAAVLFILGLRNLSSPKTASLGNFMAAVGMLVAIVATLLYQEVVDYPIVIAGIAVGGVLGAVVALRIQMTAMPQMVALLNGFGGVASALVAGAEVTTAVEAGVEPTGIVPVAMVASVLIGSVTLTGSLVAFAKLQELMRGAPIQYPGQQFVNALIALGAIGLCVVLATAPLDLSLFGVLTIVALLLGVLLVIPIGGADMPVVIALLNSYSGLAACATGFVLDNSALVISGSLVGASGLILTKIMCDAMNRSLANVLFGAFGAVSESAVSAGTSEEQGNVTAYTPMDAAVIFSSARSVIVVPGYGMAVAQAQHAVRELTDTLAEHGIEVNFAIHPVAGRMPGHMNVLLAEADVPYEQLIEMDAINPQFPETDVALVLGANDVVNPAALEDEGSPIYGMPVLEVGKAKHVFVIKRSMNPGFAGIQNPLFFKDNTMMIFGDAKKVVIALNEAVRNY